MSRKWSLGDLAIVATRSGREYRAVYALAPGIDYFWRPLVDMKVGTGLSDPDVDARPLVTIDPEDRADVDRFIDATDAEALRRGYTVPSVARSIRIDAMQAALREYANPKPPRPEEPTGLGAVVEDAEGAQYVLVAGDDEAPWVKVPVDEWQVECFAWDEIDVVRILSDGVQP